ncbi:MAG: aminotransferase class V-fold PLP-dependent enzyme [Woeseiaceae bacterium]|nr:aminotransferase class V-fold PLP-dependent enzyme [Woeseiaceae bacterium]
MSTDVVYLDYAATTPLDPRVGEFLQERFATASDFANPSSPHTAGRRAAALVDAASEQLAALVNCSPGELVWTSGATESNNLAILGGARYRQDRGRHLITMTTEHKAVIDSFRALEKQGFDVTWLPPESDGRLDPERLERAFRDDTSLVSVMYVNNETGVVQDIAAIGERCRRRDVLFHVDGAQGVGKLPVDLRAWPVDLLSMTAHKLYGPVGIGALYIANRPRCHIEALMFGGGQQRRLRPGTLPVALIAAFGRAAAIAREDMATDFEHVQTLAGRLWAGLQTVAGIVRNGDAGSCYPGILNVGIDDVDGESLLLALEPLCVGTGSACNSQTQEPSHVLRALGRSDAQAEGTIRFSIGRMTSDADIDRAVERYSAAVAHLRRLAPDRIA